MAFLTGVTYGGEWEFTSYLKIDANGWTLSCEVRSCHKHVQKSVKWFYSNSPSPNFTAIFFFLPGLEKSKVLTCPLLSTSSFGIFVLQGSRGHQFSTWRKKVHSYCSISDHNHVIHVISGTSGDWEPFKSEGRTLKCAGLYCHSFKYLTESLFIWSVAISFFLGRADMFWLGKYWSIPFTAAQLGNGVKEKMCLVPECAFSATINQYL